MPDHRLGKPAWNRGMIRPELAPTLHPTTKDICWAAGIYEGEGTCQATVLKTCRGHKRITPYINTFLQVAQKDRWILDKLRELFGGRVRQYENRQHGTARTYFRWDLWGPRARGFTMTIYQFLSPRRQMQIRDMLTAWKES